MKKYSKIILSLLAITFSSFVFSQTISIIPNEVYIGDTAEIRFSFTWDGSLFVEESSLTKINQGTLNSTLQNDYTIKSMELYPSADGYTFSLVFSPWIIGSLDIQPINIASIFDLTTDSLIIDIPEIEINSIFSVINEEKILQEPVGPVVIPGTSYLLIAISTAILIVLILVIVVLVRIKTIKRSIKKVITAILLSNNVKKACKKLALLTKQINELENKDFASQLSQIIRMYLEKHFSHPFTAETTTNFPAVFEDIFKNTEALNEKEYLKNLYEICTICDIWHYREDETEYTKIDNEKKLDLIKNTQEVFLFLEKSSTQKKELEDNNV